MKKKLLLLSFLSLILLIIGLFSYIKHNINTLKVIENKKEYVQNEDIKNSIQNLLNNFFILEDSKLPEQKFIKKYLHEANKIIDSTDNTLIYIYEDKFFRDLKNNYKRQNIKTIISIANIYKLHENQFEVDFIVKKDFNTKENTNLISSQKQYNSIIVNKGGNFKILKLYDVADFEKYITENHKLLKHFWNKEKLYDKYLNYEFRRWQERTT